MNNFIFQNETKIIFGKNTQHSVGDEIKKYASKVLLHYGGGSIKKFGLYDTVVESLRNSGIEFVELGGVKPNPRLSLVHEGIELIKREKIDFILAVGGGSVIDSAKAIGVGAYYDGDVWDFFEGKAQVEKMMSVGVILTIPAAGSEASLASVITKEEGLFKRGLGSPVMRPRFAILNPELTYTLSSYQTSCGVVDMMAHIFERYFTNTQYVELTDRLSEGTLKTIIHNAKIALKNPNDYNARAELMWASTIAHNDLLDTGRVSDWGSHDIEHEISALYDIAHGAGLAIVIPAWMEYVYQHDLNRFIQFATRVWDVDYNPYDPEATVLEGIEKTKAFFKEIGMPISLKDANINEENIEEMARKATLNGPLGQFVKLGKEDVRKILNLAK